MKDFRGLIFRRWKRKGTLLLRIGRTYYPRLFSCCFCRNCSDRWHITSHYVSCRLLIFCAQCRKKMNEIHVLMFTVMELCYLFMFDDLISFRFLRYVVERAHGSSNNLVICVCYIFLTNQLNLANYFLLRNNATPYRRFLVPRDMSVGQFIHILSSRLHLSPGKALFVFVKNTLPQTGVFNFRSCYGSTSLVLMHLWYLVPQRA